MIVRNVYRWLLRMHPRRFREEYAEEMLWVFDEEARRGPPYWLLWDGMRSLVRRRLLRDEPTASRPAVAGPDFLALNDGGLRPSRLLAGLTTAALLFGLAFGAIVDAGHVSGKLRVLTIYSYQTADQRRYELQERRAAIGRAAEAVAPATAGDAAEAAAPPAASGDAASTEAGDPTVYRLRETVEERQAQVMRALVLLDLNGDGWIDREERARPEARRWETLLLTAPRDADGRVALADLRLLVSPETPRR